MSLTIRPLTDEEIPAGYQLGRLAFGGPAEVPERFLRPVPGVLRLGAFDGSSRLIGKATDVGQSSGGVGAGWSRPTSAGSPLRPRSGAAALPGPCSGGCWPRRVSGARR